MYSFVPDEFHDQGTLLPALPSRIERFQRIHLSTPPHDLPPLPFDVRPLVYPRHVQTHEAHVFWFSGPSRQKVIWYVLQMRLYPRWVIERLVVPEVCERFGILFEL